MVLAVTKTILSARGVCKRFGGAIALDSVSFDLFGGEICGLIGENGSGKSTFIKILAGYHTPESGQLFLNGEEVALPLSGRATNGCRFTFVHQDLGLVEDLTVLENFHLRKFAFPDNRGFLNFGQLGRELREAWRRYGTLDQYDIGAVSGRLVGELSPLERAVLAIVRAVNELEEGGGNREGGDTGTGVLVLDEPTVYLPTVDRARLFALVREVVGPRRAVLFVSHDLDEVRGLCDRIVVLRDGRVAGTVGGAAAERAALIELMTGERLEELEAGTQRGGAYGAEGVRGDGAGDGAMCVRVDELRGAGIRNLSLSAREGEVVGFAGTAGSGYAEAVDLLFGVATVDAGLLTIGDDRHSLSEWTPERAIGARVGLVPGDRVRRGGIGSLLVGENLEIPLLKKFYVKGILRKGQLWAAVARLLRVFDVRPPDPRTLFSSLSGGNQQKALFAKWAQISPRLLLLQEPTQGVDVAARQGVWRAIQDLREGGRLLLLRALIMRS